MLKKYKILLVILFFIVVFLWIIEIKLERGCTSAKRISGSTNYSTHSSSATPYIKPTLVTHNERLGIISYIPNNPKHIQQFILFLYGSWRYVVDHQIELFKTLPRHHLNHVDLLAFCHPDICKEMAPFCSRIKHISEIPKHPTFQECWAIEQSFEVDIPYGALNSFIMFNRSDISNLIPRYKYILRTDNDVFISPALFRIQPMIFLHGHGGYNTVFNRKRLKEVSKRMNMIHRGVHAVGSTWCGETLQFLQIGKKTLEITRKIWLTEFESDLPGLEMIDFKQKPKGAWPMWYRPVSLLYGGELVLNHMIPDISKRNKEYLDTSSCSSMNIWKAHHIHCWHGGCEFAKFKFMRYLNSILSGSGTLSGKVFQRAINNSNDRSIQNMSLTEYSTFIAWNSLLKYSENFVKV